MDLKVTLESEAISLPFIIALHIFHSGVSQVFLLNQYMHNRYL